MKVWRETTRKTTSADFDDHGLLLDGVQGDGFVLPFLGEVTMQRREHGRAVLAKSWVQDAIVFCGNQMFGIFSSGLFNGIQATERETNPHTQYLYKR